VRELMHMRFFSGSHMSKGELKFCYGATSSKVRCTRFLDSRKLEGEVVVGDGGGLYLFVNSFVKARNVNKDPSCPHKKNTCIEILESL